MQKLLFLTHKHTNNMVKKILLFVISIAACQTAFSQEKFKFGTVPESLLKMTVYEKDTSANVLVVYEDCDMYYQWNTLGGFNRITEYVVRFKVLRQAGVDYAANNSIAFIKGNLSSETEQISDFQAFTYNLENGKTVKTKLEKQYINVEDVTEHLKKQKFAMPAVKVGSVVEYKYTLSSPFYSSPIHYTFQRSIPVQFSKLTTVIPSFFTFNSEIRGYETIKTDIQIVNLNFNLGGYQMPCNGRQTTAQTTDLPALKADNYVWNVNDFLTGMNFELMRVSINDPNFKPFYKDFSQTWTSL